MGAMEKTDRMSSGGAREYLTFRLDQEEYGIDIMSYSGSEISGESSA